MAPSPRTLTVDCGAADTAADAEATWQLSAMTPEVVAALALLPTLGQNRAGPLAPGRLSHGHVGRTIRLIQLRVAAHC